MKQQKHQNDTETVTMEDQPQQPELQEIVRNWLVLSEKPEKR